MMIPNELYTQTLVEPLSANAVTYGTSYTKYEVRQITDVRNLGYVRAYRITCTQRVVIPNLTPYSLTPSAVNTFENYPALLSSQFKLDVAAESDLRLITYSPRTMNTTVMTSANQSDGTNQSFSRQHTTGSSVSQTNTYGGSASVGFFGEDPTGSVSADYSHSTTTEHSTSDSTGSDTGSSREQGASDSMSIKDWGAYAYLDAGCTTPTWVWGQEYPWDVIQYRYCPTDNAVALPAFVTDRMFDELNGQTLVFPPSQLSLFGVDFTMKAVWQIQLPAALEEQAVTVDHTLQYLTASHGYGGDPAAAFVTLDPAPMGFSITSPSLDLTLLGLDAITSGAAQNGAVIGFIPSKFVVPPAEGAAFKILSDANNLQITGAGFDAPMTTTFAAAVTLSIQFKVLDGDTQYALFMKHWKTGPTGCTLSFVFNGDTANPVIRHVDAAEGDGGEENLTTISLRNRDYTSIDYHDYLVKGLNTIDVTITADRSGAGYLLRALAIGES